MGALGEDCLGSAVDQSHCSGTSHRVPDEFRFFFSSRKQTNIFSPLLPGTSVVSLMQHLGRRCSSALILPYSQTRSFFHYPHSVPLSSLHFGASFCSFFRHPSFCTAAGSRGSPPAGEHALQNSPRESPEAPPVIYVCSNTTQPTTVIGVYYMIGEPSRGLKHHPSCKSDRMSLPPPLDPDICGLPFQQCQPLVPQFHARRPPTAWNPSLTFPFLPVRRRCRDRTAPFPR